MTLCVKCVNGQLNAVFVSFYHINSEHKIVSSFKNNTHTHTNCQNDHCYDTSNRKSFQMLGVRLKDTKLQPDTDPDDYTSPKSYQM